MLEYRNFAWVEKNYVSAHIKSQRWGRGVGLRYYLITGPRDNSLSGSHIPINYV